MVASKELSLLYEMKTNDGFVSVLLLSLSLLPLPLWELQNYQGKTHKQTAYIQGNMA